MSNNKRIKKKERQQVIHYCCLQWYKTPHYMQKFFFPFLFNCKVFQSVVAVEPQERVDWLFNTWYPAKCQAKQHSEVSLFLGLTLSWWSTFLFHIELLLPLHPFATMLCFVTPLLENPANGRYFTQSISNFLPWGQHISFEN